MLARRSRPFALAGEQFLRDRVAVVVREHVDVAHAEVVEQRHAQVRLQRDRVVAIARLLRHPKPSRSSAYSEYRAASRGHTRPQS